MNDYISSYGGIGPVNPELTRHVDHDISEPAEVIDFPEPALPLSREASADAVGA